MPTLTPQVTAALKLADLQPGQTLLELGCGDGKVVLAAAKQGIQVVGYELNPLLAAVTWLRTWRYRHLVTIKCQNFWQASLPKADCVFVFLLPKFMAKLDKKISETHQPGIKVVSFAFTIPNKAVSSEQHGVYLYTY